MTNEDRRMNDKQTEWVLVPREPDGDMLYAAIDAHIDFDGEDEVDAVWAAMLAAAPTPPAEAQPDHCTDHQRHVWGCRPCEEAAGKFNESAGAQVVGGGDDPQWFADALSAAGKSEPLPASGGEARQWQPNYERMFIAAVASLAEISVALGIPDEVAETAFGNTEILAAIAALSAQPRQSGGDAWPASVRDEALEVLRNVDTQLSATGQASARIERLINVLAGMNTTTSQPASAPVGAKAQVGGDRKPDGHHYRYPYGHDGWVIRKNEGGEVNGVRPIEAVPYWYTAPPSAPVGVEGLAEMWKREAAELVRNARDARARGAATVDDFARADRLDAKADGLHEAAADLLALVQQPAAVDEGPTHRLLSSADEIRADDEFLGDDTVTWLPVGKEFLSASMCGKKYNPAFLQPMRRAIAALAQPQGADHDRLR